MILLSDVDDAFLFTEISGGVSYLQMRERHVQVPRLLLHHGRGFLVGSLC